MPSTSPGPTTRDCAPTGRGCAATKATITRRSSTSWPRPASTKPAVGEAGGGEAGVGGVDKVGDAGSGGEPAGLGSDAAPADDAAPAAGDWSSGASDAPLRERGYAHILATLCSDLEFERLAVEKYAAFAKQLADPRLKALMREFVRAETGHGRGLKRTIERVRAADYPVVVYCPTCGWELDYGTEPQTGATVHCPMCAMNFALHARDGDFVLERV